MMTLLTILLAATPIPVAEINSPYNEFGVTLSQDGQTAIFDSTRGGGNSHLYQATRIEPNGPFGNVQPIPELNSGATDAQPWLSRDGKRIYFISTRDSGGPWQDIWMATRSDVSGPWSGVRNLSE